MPLRLLDELVCVGLGLSEHPIALLADASSLPDLLGVGHPELVDHVEERLLVDHDHRAERHSLRRVDQVLQAID
jgi:hypothetical protein